MVLVETSDGTFYELPDILPPAPVAAAYIQSGSTELDVTDFDGRHLVLAGTLGASDHYIDCVDDNGASKFEVSGTGLVTATDLAIGSINSAVTDITANTTQTAKIANAGTATSTNTANALVQRASGSNFTEIDRVSSEVIRAFGTNPSVALYGNGSIDFVPLDANGAAVPNTRYSFG